MANKGVNRKLLLIYFIFARIWLSWCSKYPVGVDAWDYMNWINLSVITGDLNHAPLHVPGFYSVVSVIASYTRLDMIFLYSIILPLIAAAALFFTIEPISNEWGIVIASAYGFFVLRTSMIIPELLGLILLPASIYSITDLVKNKTKKSFFISLLLINCIIWSHHLSGGIILIILLYYTICNRSVNLISMSLICSISAVISWSIAGNFPITLIFLLVNQIGIFMFISFSIVGSVLIWKFNFSTFNTTIMNSFSKIRYILMISTILVALLVGMDFNTILYWSPSLVLLYLAFQNTDKESQFLEWVVSLLLLSLVLVFIPNLRPLLSRILVFNIQSLIPIAGISLTYIIDRIHEKKGEIYLFGAIISLLLLTSFHSYPIDSAWFGTEFRYFDDEVEMAFTVGSHTNLIEIDTDNRLGVIILGSVGKNSSFGEYNDSWLTKSLMNISSPIPENTWFIISDTIRQSGFMNGKFIHGQGGGADNISLSFNKSVEEFMNYKLLRIMQIGSVIVWTSFQEQNIHYLS